MRFASTLAALAFLAWGAQASTRTEPGDGQAGPSPAASSWTGSLLLEGLHADHPGLVGVRLGAQGAGDDGSFHLGVGFLGAENHDDVMMEVFAGGRRHLWEARRRALVPHVGLGALVAFSTETYSAEEDDLDNDDDGAVDEDGETETDISDLFLALTPEAGLTLNLGRRTSLTTSLRYQLRSSGVDDSPWVLAVGLALSLED
jgi:hypothetical protein